MQLKLERYEAFIINRKRQNLKRKQIAKLAGITTSGYTSLEKEQYNKNYKHILTPIIKDLTEAEELTILRKRHGITQEQLAEEVGCTRLWVNKMEKGLVNTFLLRRFWNAY